MVETTNLEIGQTVMESVKLSKMSKGYQWEIRLLPIDRISWTDDDMKRLNKFNDYMEKEYGGIE